MQREHVVAIDLGLFRSELQWMGELLHKRGLVLRRVSGSIEEIAMQLNSEPPAVLILPGLGLEQIERYPVLSRARVVVMSDDHKVLAEAVKLGAIPLAIPFTGDRVFWAALGLISTEASVAATEATEALMSNDLPDLRPRAPRVKSAPAAPAAAEVAAAKRDAALRALSDGPIALDEADALAFGPYADALAALIENPETGTPLTIAINAPWGAGKSSLARMIEQRLTGGNKNAPNDDRPHITSWFNAWMHDDAPNLATAFAAHVSRDANLHRGVWHRLRYPLPRALWSKPERRLFWASIVAVFTLVFVVLSELWQWFASDFWRPLLELAELSGGGSIIAAFDARPGAQTHFGVSTVALTTLLTLLSKPLTAARSVASYLENPEAAANLGTIAEVRKQLGTLLDQARGGTRRFVVFIDDLERCRPPRAVDVLEVVNQLIDHPGVVVVIMADMASVAASADLKYKDIAERFVRPGAGGATRPGDYGRTYLQKIIQLQFDLPPHPPAHLLGLLEGVTKPAPPAPPAPPPSSALERALRSFVELSLRPYRAPWRWLVQRVSAIVDPYARAFVLTHHPPVEYGDEEVRVRILAWLRIPIGVSVVFVFPAGVFVTPIETAACTGVLLLSFVLSAGSVDRWQRRVAQDRVRRLLDRQLARPSVDEIKLAAADFDDETQSAAELAALLRERKWLRVMNDADVIKDAYREVAEYLIRHPRSTKRFVNHVRVLVAAAGARDALGGEPALSAKHIARFILFKERWPLAAQAVLQRPALLAKLEQTAGECSAESTAALATELAALHAEAWDAPALAEFLSSGTAPLGELAERLVYLTPADPSAEHAPP